MRTLSPEEWQHALLNTQGGTVKYPWDEWFDGEPHLIERGIDYLILDKNMRKNIYRKQRKYGPIWCLSHEDGFLIKAGKPNDIWRKCKEQ